MPKQDIAIIKVGKESTLRLRGIRTYRAITVKELVSIQESNDNVRFIVIEQITEDEYNLLCDFARRLTGLGIKILFFCNTNDEVTSGAADELDIDIIDNKEDLYAKINEIGLNVNPDIHEQAKEIGIKDTFEPDDPFNTEYDALDEAANTVKKASDLLKNRDKLEELPTILSKSDIEEGFTDNDLGIGDGVEEGKDEGNGIKNGNTGNNDTRNNDTENGYNTSISTKPTTSSTPKTSDSTDIEISTLNLELDAVKSKLSSTESELSNTKSELSNTKSELVNAKSKIDEAVNKINKLNKIIKSINSEKSLLEKELSRLETLDIIEDPILVAEYDTIKLKLKELENGQGVSSTELKEAQLNLEKANTCIVELQSIKSELEGKLTDCQNSLRASELVAEESKRSLNDSIEKVSTLEAKLFELQNDNTDKDKLKEAKLRIEDLTKSLSEANDEVESLRYKVRSGATNRVILMGMIKKAIDKLSTFESVISGQRDDINSLRDQNYQLQTKLTEVQEANFDLTKKLEESSNSVELAVQEHHDELEKITNDNIGLQSQIEILKNQLISKENQCKSLMVAAESSQSVSALENKNMALEEMNRTLRSELGKLQKDLGDIAREKGVMNESIQRLTEDNRTLKQKINALSAGISGSGMGSLIGKITTSGRGLVLPVFGCGSYGTTTSAVSLAYYLSLNSKVVFIDMDLISAKSDNWFGFPLVQTLMNVPDNSKRSTGLGIFFDRGFTFFSENYDKIILRKIKTKGGCIDYIGGLYYKIDALKLASADFSGLITLCKNNYDYIVIDCGRLGANSLNDQLTCAMADISYKTVVVTPSEFIEVRNFRNLIQEEHIDVTKIAWMLNMCHNTRISDKMRNMLSATKYAQIPYIDNLFEIVDGGYKRKHFLQERLSKDKFSYFVNSCIFNK